MFAKISNKLVLLCKYYLANSLVCRLVPFLMDIGGQLKSSEIYLRTLTDHFGPSFAISKPISACGWFDIVIYLGISRFRLILNKSSAVKARKSPVIFTTIDYHRLLRNLSALYR